MILTATIFPGLKELRQTGIAWGQGNAPPIDTLGMGGKIMTPIVMVGWIGVLALGLWPRRDLG